MKDMKAWRFSAFHLESSITCVRSWLRISVRRDWLNCSLLCKKKEWKHTKLLTGKSYLAEMYFNSNVHVFQWSRFLRENWHSPKRLNIVGLSVPFSAIQGTERPFRHCFSPMHDIGLSSGNHFQRTEVKINSTKILIHTMQYVCCHLWYPPSVDAHDHLCH